MPDEPGRSSSLDEAAALSELVACENLTSVSAWAARWSASAAGAEAAILWTPDPLHPLLIATGSFGGGSRERARRSVSRDEPIVRDLLRDRQPRLLSAAETPESLAPPRGATAGWTVVIPMAVSCAPGGVPAAVLALAFESKPRLDEVAHRLDPLRGPATRALDNALRAERRSAGMLHAIERLTNLYDVSKAFGSTIDGDELAKLIARKAVELMAAEAGTLWLLEDDESVAAAATAVNENYEIASPPENVGADVVGDVLADRLLLREKGLLAAPLVEDDRAIGALVLANKRGRAREFSEDDAELLEDLSKQAVRGLRNARQHEAEQRVEELDALLAVSREITATLDLDKVMKGIVNATSALISYDRCGIAVQERGRLRLGAVSGIEKLDRGNPDVRRLEDLLQWIFFSGSDVNVTLREDGSIAADRPETEEKFRAYFAETGSKSFFGVLLRDEEGKLGALAFECREPLLFDEATRDLLQILVNQATVAVRNAQLYRQVPLAGFLKPLAAGRRRLLEAPRKRVAKWTLGAVAVLVVLALPWRLRVGGPARVLPARQSVVTAGVDGVVASVAHREGDRVAAGEVIAQLEDDAYRASLADAEGAYRIAESEIAQNQQAGSPAAMYEAQSRRDELAARIALERDRLARTSLVAAVSGVIITPHLQERVGQNLARGAEFCVVADVRSVIAEVGVSEEDASLLHPGEPAVLKWNPYPGRTFAGTVQRVGARIRESGKDRFVIAEVRLENSDGLLKTGMVGRGKITAGRRPIGFLLLRKPARWLYSKIWPLLP